MMNSDPIQGRFCVSILDHPSYVLHNKRLPWSHLHSQRSLTGHGHGHDE